MLFIKSLAVLSSLIATAIFLSDSAWAQSKFSANYNVTYDIGTSGITVTNQKIDLRNLTANFYATEYSLSIGATTIENVSATSSSGASIPVSVVTESETTKIKVIFNEKVVGLNRVLSFRLRYESRDIAVRNGFVWEVTIPKLATSENIDSYNLSLRAPREIGSVASISPAPASQAVEGNFNVFNYNKSQLTSSGVNASFGDHQVFNFNLKYHLANSKFFPVLETIALPPDTETQTVIYTDLSPKPLEITVDTDGNYLAKYRLNGNEKIDINLIGQVKIWNKPTNEPRHKWTPDQLKKYTAPDKYWETNFPAISEKAKELKTAKAIYDYVSTTLKYDYERAAGKLERLGAAVAFNQPTKAVCMEFTDLFIALARAAGIPAREVDGYAYTTNSRLKPRSFTGAGERDKSDILHAWAQYWNEETSSWVQIDPTWGSTTGGVDYFNKLDMNHFVFVIKGLSSNEPYPAGSYKTDPSSQTGDVEVILSPAETEITVNPAVLTNLSGELTAGLPFGGNIIVTNSGNATIFGGKLAFKSSFLKIGPADLGPIPPFSQKEVPIQSRAGGFDLEAVDQITTTLTGKNAKGEDVQIEAVNNVSIKPLFQMILPWLGGAVLIIILLTILKKAWPTIKPNLARYIPWLLKEPS